jgi:hypothetical protein
VAQAHFPEGLILQQSAGNMDVGAAHRCAVFLIARAQEIRAAR